MFLVHFGRVDFKFRWEVVGLSNGFWIGGRTL